MPQQNSGRKVKSQQQKIMALELRAAGASFQQIASALSVSKPRAFRIVRKALDDLVQHRQETAERVRQLELYRLDHLRMALDPKRGDPRAADTLIRISERVAKLHGLDAPQRTEATGPDGGPIQTEEQPDFSKLTLDELLILEALNNKAHGIRNWDEHVRSHEKSERMYHRGNEQLSLVSQFVRALPTEIAVAVPPTNSHALLAP